MWPQRGPRRLGTLQDGQGCIRSAASAAVGGAFFEARLRKEFARSVLFAVHLQGVQRIASQCAFHRTKERRLVSSFVVCVGCDSDIWLFSFVDQTPLSSLGAPWGLKGNFAAGLQCVFASQDAANTAPSLHQGPSATGVGGEGSHLTAVV